MNSGPSSPPTTSTTPVVPTHWTPEQALAVAECLQAMREALWALYGPQMQQAWCEQLMPPGTPPEFDPDVPF
ncbi:MAG: hypothetical protein IPP87_17375 [Ideonella sp.]|nr:hypothetical protein [Ideonella sp.]MBL0150353.1 hypothetical protein [Ideonella sp.]